jgi:hypothetical protein
MRAALYHGIAGAKDILNLQFTYYYEALTHL